jgi:hypothetical protein
MNLISFFLLLAVSISAAFYENNVFIDAGNEIENITGSSCAYFPQKYSSVGSHDTVFKYLREGQPVPCPLRSKTPELFPATIEPRDHMPRVDFENDFIHDPEAGIEPVNEPSKFQVLNEQEPVTSIRGLPLSATTSAEYSTSFESLSPSAISEPSTRLPKVRNHDNLLHVPERCRNYDRLWDFYIGPIENQSLPIGWISRLAYAMDIISGLKLPRTDAFYTLIPSLYASKEEILPILPFAYYLEIVCRPFSAFNNLFLLSVHLENRIKRGIVIGVNLIFYQNFASIKIIIDSTKEPIRFSKFRRNLNPLFPLISHYIPYKI